MPTDGELVKEPRYELLDVAYHVATRKNRLALCTPAPGGSAWRVYRPQRSERTHRRVRVAVCEVLSAKWVRQGVGPFSYIILVSLYVLYTHLHTHVYMYPVICVCVCINTFPF